MTSVATSTPPELPPIVDAKRLPALDGLRGIAILLVLVHHLLYRLRLCPGFVHYLVAAGGLSWSGVDLFFVLSGFLIGGILLDARNSPGYYRTFYARRAFRILPIYLVLLGLCTVRYIPLSWSASRLGGFSRMEIPWIAYLTLTQNFWMATLGSWGLGTLTPTWSLAVEEQFYLTVPTIIRKVGQHRLVALLLVVTASAPIFRALLQHFGQPNGIAVYVLMPSRADALSCGILCAILLRHRYWKSLVSRRHLLWGLFGMLLVGMLALTYEQVNPFVGRGSSVQYSIVCFFYASVLLLALSHSGPFLKVLTVRPLMQLGTVAYFSYLFHIPIIEISMRLMKVTVTDEGNVKFVVLAYLLGVAVTLSLAWLSWIFFEEPLIRRGRAYTY